MLYSIKIYDMTKKSIIPLAFLLLTFEAAFSQTTDTIQMTNVVKPDKQHTEMQTLLGNDHESGGYGAFTVGYSLIDNRQAILFGGRFEWIANHSFGFGFGGTGFMNEFHFEPLLNSDVALAGGYGGIYIEPILMPKYPVHISFPVLFGAGGISYVSKNYDNHNNMMEDSEGFLIVEPGAEIELNLTRHFRFTLGVSYKFPSAFNLGTTATTIVNAESLKGMSYFATFKFGRF
jgi:hypothetical protein